jgi:hypothetical protein
MLDLIDKAIEAHGGIERWRQVSKVSATFHPSGLSLKLRGQEAFSKQPTRVVVETQEQRVTITPFIEPDRVGIYQPNRTAIEALDGKVIEELNDPRSSFKPAGPWSGPQLIYFAGHALWTYFNLPFRLSGDDIKLEELEPRREGAETWRAVKVIFPSSIATLSSEQVLYFDHKGLIRREDYSVEVAGTGPVAHYLDGHRMFDGIAFPTRRRIYPMMPDGSPQRDVVIMSADLSDYRLS